MREAQAKAVGNERTCAQPRSTGRCQQTLRESSHGHPSDGQQPSSSSQRGKNTNQASNMMLIVLTVNTKIRKIRNILKGVWLQCKLSQAVLGLFRYDHEKATITCIACDLFHILTSKHHE